ncbi:replication factor-A carboxy-terminal domain protein, partial [Trifolium medium]|nr:replication factor-A carboxy-terminal domain protein [Trifolium medium]
MLGKSPGGIPVVVVQFAKLKIFKENVSIQNVMNTTRILVNPEIEEALALKNVIAEYGIAPTSFVSLLGSRGKPSLEDDFLGIYPKKSISQLNQMTEDGIFVVCAIVDGLVDGEDWWYPACKCHRSVTRDS